MTHGFDIAAARSMLATVFASWVQQLDLEVVSADGGRIVLRMPHAPRLCRDNGVICGQALMALADTAMALAVAGASGRYRPMTTVDQTTHFMKPAASAAVVATATILLRLGKTTAFGRVDLVSEADGKAVAAVQSAYALL